MAELTHPYSDLPALPDWATQYVGYVVSWTEQLPTVENPEPEPEPALVLGVRWARQPDGALLGVEAVQFLMERADGSSRWSAPQLAPNRIGG